MVWMVWIQCRFCLGANGLAVQALGTTTVAAQPEWLGYF
jgi:hypothetical protein